jgi:hypothetical protein
MKMTEALPDKPAKLPEVRESDGIVQIVIDMSREETVRGLRQCFGTTDTNVINTMINHLGKVAVVPVGKSAEYTKAQLAIMQSIGPKDAAECLLAVQMLGIHSLMVRCTSHANMDDQTSYGIEANVNRAIKLSRTYVAQLQGLKDYRNRGKQTIHVKHVNVSDNTQAVIGDIHQGGGEGG